MPVPISNVTRRAVYAPTGTGGEGPYAFTFEILANTDIAVYKDDTLLTLTTHYTVVINANGTGSVTITATGLALSPTSPTQYAIVGNRTISRSTDFTTGGDFFANTLNDELDQQTIFAQQNAEGIVRSLQAPQTDPTTINMILPRSTVRASKVLAFDSSGNPTATEFIGSNRGNWATSTLYYVRDIVKDTSNSNIYNCLTQHTSTGSQPISSNADVAKWSLLVDAAAAGASATAAAASASAAATSASGASTSATNASNSASTASTQATNAATSASNASTSATAAAASATAAAASFDAFDDIYLGAKATNPTVDNDGNTLTTGDQYFNTVSNELRVWNGSTWQAASTVGGTVASLSVTGNTTLGDASADTLTINATVQPGMIISGTDNTNAALRITQLGTGNALLVEDSSNPDSTPFVIDATGAVAVGATTSAALTISGTPQLSQGGASATNSRNAFSRWDASATGFAMQFGKSRSGTVGTFGIVSSGDSAGQLQFFGDDGAAFVQLATIGANVDGTPGTNDMPGRLVFSTTADGASSSTEAMRINSAQNVSIGTSSAAAGTTLRLSKSITGAVASYVILNNGTIQSDVTTSANIFTSNVSTVASAFTLATLRHFYVNQGTVGATSAITNQYGFFAESGMTGATNNYGFYGDIASGTGRYNLYMNGTANNYMAGQLQLGDGTAAAPALSNFGDENTGIFFPAADTIAFSEGGVEAMRINASGNLQTLATIGVGNATPSTSGAGITFPATQSASSDANTLDDYEEGTWTPTLKFGGATTGITYSQQNGSYIKVGKNVFITLYILLTSKGSATGIASITGLPFSNAFTPAVVGCCGFDVNYSLVANSGVYSLTDSSSAQILLRTHGASSYSDISNSNFNNNTGFYVATTYVATA